MIRLTEKQIEEALPKIEKGLRTYCWLQSRLNQCDCSSDPYFQTTYNRFYRVRRDENWRREYFRILETAKRDGIEFETALLEIYEKTDRIEASFASKLVATLNPDKPVIDKYVLSNFGLRLPYYYDRNRLSKIVNIYYSLVNCYRSFMQKPIVQVLYERFKEHYSWASISDLKKVDLILWQIRPQKT